MLGSIDLIGGSLVLIVSSLVFAYILLKPKKLKITIDKIIAVILGIVIYGIIANYTDGTIKSLCLCCLYFTLFKSIFKISYIETIFLAFLYVILIMIPDILILVFSFLVLKIPTELFYAQFAEKIVATIIVNIIFIILVYIFRKPLRKILKLSSIINKEIISYTILTLGCVLVVFYNAMADVKIISKNFLVSIIIMIVFVIILYSLIRQKMENDKIVEKYDKLLEFIKKYEVIIEEQREARHESKNQLITIKSRILNKVKGEEIIKYVDSILKDHKSYNEDKYGKFQYLPANGIKGLFYYKSMEAEEKEINLSINIGKRVENSVMSKLSTEDFKQLGRLIGVYIDNAIEASSVSEEKKIGIEIYTHDENVIIIIMNTYAGEIDEESVGKVRYSTKGNNRGYGLMLVNKILSNSKRFVAERTVTDKLYIQKLIIKNNV